MNCASFLIGVIVFSSGVSFAQSSFDKVGIPIFKKSVLASFVQTAQGKACPAAGSQSLDHLSQSVGSASSSVDSVARLIENVKPRRDQLNVDSSRCGQCQQVNQVATFTTSEPANTLTDSSCNNRPTTNFKKLLPMDQVENFVDSTLRGNNPEGQALTQGCPDPCSFYVASAVSDRGSNQSLLNLTVHCGQPRDGSILFADYKYTAGLIQSWSCK